MITQNIQHKLAVEDTAELGQEVAKLHGEVLQLEGEKADASKSFKARIDAKWTKINELNERIRKGYVDVEVQCDVYFNLPTPGLKVFWDYASARIVKTEPMTSGDRQTQLFDHREPPPELLDELLKDKDVTEE